MGQINVYGPDPISLEGRAGSRYWVRHDRPFTGDAEVDARLSDFPVAVFQPGGRPAAETPVVVGLQGIAAPYQWNAFLVPTLLDMGIACVLLDSPLGGERSLRRAGGADVVAEAAALRGRGVPLAAGLIPATLEAVAGDIGTALDLVGRHGLRSDRLALFGVSWGTVLCSYAFTRHGLGGRLLGTLGHADLPRFVRSYTPPLTSVLTTPPGRLAVKLAGLVLSPYLKAALDYLTVLHRAAGDGELMRRANPMTYAGQVGRDRRARFLVGREDPLVNWADALACAQGFADGEAYVVPGLGHGGHTRGPSFVEHVRYFLGTQLGDWRW